MLARSVYEEAKRDIKAHAAAHTSALKLELEAETVLYRAIKNAQAIGINYHRLLTNIIFKRLREVGNHAVDYYGSALSDLEKEQQVGLAMDELVHSKYYGLTLPQRIKESHLKLKQNIRRSGSVGAKFDTRLLNITRVFNQTYPFGAQQNWDIRLFLAEAVRLEHVIAKNIAVLHGHKLVRWTLSKAHAQTDYCDQLATVVNENVTAYIEANKLSIDPAGVYFIENVPAIPHPNCQCVVKYITETKRRKPAPKKKLNLIQRILKAIFK